MKILQQERLRTWIGKQRIKGERAQWRERPGSRSGAPASAAPEPDSWPGLSELSLRPPGAGTHGRAAFPTDTSRGWAVSAADCSAQTARAAQTHSAAAGSTHAGEAALSLRVRNRPWLRKDTAQDMGLVLSFGLQMKASNLAGRRHNYRRIIFVTCYKQKLYWEYEIAMSCRS